MKQNILALYLIKLSKWFSLVMPIIVLLRGSWVRIARRIYFEEAFIIAAVTLRFPGLSGGRMGRKKCLILGCILFFGGYPMLFFHLHFHGISSPRFCWEPGKPLVNGADSALLYDTTVRYKKKNFICGMRDVSR